MPRCKGDLALDAAVLLWLTGAMLFSLWAAGCELKVG